MPELPEVHTIATQLDRVLVGRVIKEIEVLNNKSFSGSDSQLIGKSIKQITRRAKNIIFKFKDDDYVMMAHLKMTGQLIFQGGDKRVVGGHPTADWVNELPSKHTRVIITFTDKAKLYFNDQRKFGWIKVMSNAKFQMLKEKLPPDVVDKEFTVEYLKQVVKGSSRAIKLVILDQAKMGGMGNIYANDALYLSGTNPTRSANTLTDAEIKRLHGAMIQVIQRGIELGGASESTFKHIDGLGGKYQTEFLVYKREGEACGLKGCQGVIQKISVGGRGTYFCPVHQK